MNYHPCTTILIQALLEIGTSRAYRAISDWDHARKIVDDKFDLSYWLCKTYDGSYFVTRTKFSKSDIELYKGDNVTVIQRME